MKRLWDYLLNAEPVMFVTVVLVVALAAVQSAIGGAGVLTIIESVIVAALGFATRSQVSSPNTHADLVGQIHTLEAELAEAA